MGPIDRLRTIYISDRPLARIDIINLLTTGQTTEAASKNVTTPQSVIAGQLTSQFGSRVEKLAGISSLTIDPQVGSGQGNGVGRLAVQKRVTKNLFFTFTTDLTISTGQLVQVGYSSVQPGSPSTPSAIRTGDTPCSSRFTRISECPRRVPARCSLSP